MSDLIKNFDVKKYHKILDRGLSDGLGERDSQMCIEAAICTVLKLPHGDDPGCVTPAIRFFKIALNDCRWSSPETRANGLRELGLAQLGSLGVVDDVDFISKLSEKIIRKLIPTLFREVFPSNKKCLDAADRCEQEGTSESAKYAASAAKYAAGYAASAAESAAKCAKYAAKCAKCAESAAESAEYSPNNDPDKYLKIAAQCALDVLIELKSPGCELLGVKP